MPTSHYVTAKGNPACASVFAEAYGIAHQPSAKAFIPYLRKHPEKFRELRTGEPPQADDIAVWARYGSTKGSAGWKWGHIGSVQIAKNGYPTALSLFNGKIQYISLNGRGPVTYFRMR